MKNVSPSVVTLDSF